jgi:hypothetical protein
MRSLSRNRKLQLIGSNIIWSGKALHRCRSPRLHLRKIIPLLVAFTASSRTIIGGGSRRLSPLHYSVEKAFLVVEFQELAVLANFGDEWRISAHDFYSKVLIGGSFRAL